MRHFLHRVDHPEFGNAEMGVDQRLAAEIPAEARIGDLDSEARRARVEIGQPVRLAEEDEVGLDEAVLAEPEGGFAGEDELSWPRIGEIQCESGLERLVPDALRIHGHDLPADQFEPLMLVQNAGLNQRLDLGHGPAPALQPLGGPGGHREPGGAQGRIAQEQVHGDEDSIDDGGGKWFSPARDIGTRLDIAVMCGLSCSSSGRRNVKVTIPFNSDRLRCKGNGSVGLAAMTGSQPSKIIASVVSYRNIKRILHPPFKWDDPLACLEAIMLSYNSLFNLT